MAIATSDQIKVPNVEKFWFYPFPTFLLEYKVHLCLRAYLKKPSIAIFSNTFFFTDDDV